MGRGLAGAVGWLALVRVDLDGLDVPVKGDDVALGRLVGQVAGTQVNTGQEGVVGLLLNDLHADGVAIGSEIHIVGGVLGCTRPRTSMLYWAVEA